MPLHSALSASSAPPATQAADDGAEEWVCTQCTYLNLASVSTCDLCDARRPGAAAVVQVNSTAPAMEPATTVTAAEQICPTCTFSNPATATKCDLCEGPLPGLGGSAPATTASGGFGQFQDDDYGDDDFEADPEFERIMEQSRRESAGTFAAQSTSTWTCAVCTFSDNLDSAAECSLCGSDRP